MTTPTLPTAGPGSTDRPAPVPNPYRADLAPATPRKVRGGRTTRSIAWPIRLLAGLVAAGLVVLAGLTLLGPMLRKEVTRSHPIDATVTALELRGDRGAIQIRAAADGERPHVEERTVWSLREVTSSVTQEGGTLDVRSRCEGNAFNSPCSTDWTVVIPADASVTVRNPIGSIEVDGMAGPISVTSNAAEVVVRDTTAEEIDVVANVGDVRVVAAAPVRRMEVRTDVGAIDVTVPRGERYRVSVTAEVGEAVSTVDDDPAADRDIVLRTEVGDLRLGHSR